MLTTLIIMDVTRMQGDRVCIAGVTPDNQCIRPVLPPPGVRELHLLSNGVPLIFPRAKVQFDLHTIPVEPPHIEDQEFDPTSTRPMGVCSDAEWERRLLSSCSLTVTRLYDGLLQEPRYILPKSPTRSLGTITNVGIDGISLKMNSFRLFFLDGSGRFYSNVPIVDMDFRQYATRQLRQNKSVETAEDRIYSTLHHARRVYLRLGLARPWEPEDGSYPEACWLQVTGIYTFPDYLGRWRAPA